MEQNIMKTIEKIFDKQNVVYIGSIDELGFPNIKAVFKPRGREGLRIFYISTNTSSKHVNQYRLNCKACMYFMDRRLYRGIMMNGTMEVLEDSAIKERFWQKGDSMYYPEGVTDPDYCILRFTATEGRYYSNLGSQDFFID